MGDWAETWEPQSFCEIEGHDWRVNPHIVLTTNPPRQQLVCAECGDTSSRPQPNCGPAVSNDPRTWERA